MKQISMQILTLTAIFFVFCSTATGEMTIKAGLDMAGTVDVGGNDSDVDAGYVFTFEVITPVTQQLLMGGGIAYQLARGLDGSDAEFGCTPLYLLLRLNFSRSAATPYAVIHAGYNFLRADKLQSGQDEKGGTYYGIGAGMRFGNGFLIKALYSVNEFEFTGGGSGNNEFEYSKLTTSVGFSFN
jgi:outer membrane protein with beta-barrel domain